MSKINHAGDKGYRFKSNPEEKLFIDAWVKENRLGHILEYLVGDGTKRGEITQRDATIAAAVVQWFGSPVGRCFLSDLGYMKELSLVKKRT